MDFQLIGIIVAAVILLYVVIKNNKKDKDKSNKEVKNYVKRIHSGLAKGYMSVAKIGNRIYGGTYNLNATNYLVFQNGKHSVDCYESVYKIHADPSGVMLACENARGKIFRIQNNKAEPIWDKGRDSITWIERFNNNLVAISTEFTNGGVTFHNITTGVNKVLANNHVHARQIIEYKKAYFILAYNYETNQGGWYFSQDLVNWSWRGMMNNMRPLKAVVHNGIMYIACSPFVNNTRVPPATIMAYDGKNMRVEYKSDTNHAMFFGIASDGKDIWAGTLTNWRGSGNALLYRKEGNTWKPIWKAPHPEITDLYAENGVVWIALRDERGGGAVYELSGNPGLNAR